MSPQVLFISIVLLWSGTGNFYLIVNFGVDHLDIVQVMVFVRVQVH